jgi:pimeloyl-ACP methyl ester carboxylesterase
MAQHIEGPLYYERMGRSGPVIAFVHPNPMNQSCWIFQMAHLSTWYRCIAIDIPGYGRSPRPPRPYHGRHGGGVLGSDRRRIFGRDRDPCRLLGRIEHSALDASSRNMWKSATRC